MACYVTGILTLYIKIVIIYSDFYSVSYAFIYTRWHL